MVKIGVYQLFSNSSLYEHRCLENIKIKYQSADKCDYQRQYKSIIESIMVYTPEVFSENSQMSSGQSVSIKKTKSRKSLPRFATALDVKPNTAVHRLCADKSNIKSIKSGRQLWSKTPKRQGR